MLRAAKYWNQLLTLGESTCLLEAVFIFWRGNKCSDTEFAYLASTISRDLASIFRSTDPADNLASVYFGICITFALATSTGRALEYSPLRRSTRPEDLTASISSPRPSPLSLTLIKYLRIVGKILFICIFDYQAGWYHRLFATSPESQKFRFFH